MTPSKSSLKKAEAHLSDGDVAQSSEKLFGAVKFALREYVTRLSKAHLTPVMKPSEWSYANYRKLSIILTKFDFEGQRFDISIGWALAE